MTASNEARQMGGTAEHRTVVEKFGSDSPTSHTCSKFSCYQTSDSKPSTSITPQSSACVAHSPLIKSITPQMSLFFNLLAILYPSGGFWPKDTKLLV
jgi:hypothetical protein